MGKVVAGAAITALCLSTIVLSVQNHRLQQDVIGRIQACEVCHFGGDAETVKGQLAAFQGQINDHDAMLSKIDDEIAWQRHAHYEQREKVEDLETWADEAVGNWPWDTVTKDETEARRATIRAKSIQLSLNIKDPKLRQDSLRQLENKPADQWTYHEVRPLNGEPWVEWIEGPRSPDPKHRPPMPPKLKKYANEGAPKTDLLHGWKDKTIDGGYLWEEF